MRSKMLFGVVLLAMSFCGFVNAEDNMEAAKAAKRGTS